MAPIKTGESTLSNGFVYAANDNQPTQSKKRKPETKPFCLRLTKEERAYLERKSGNQRLGAYCRSVLLGAQESARIVERKPKVNYQQYAALLSGLGESRIASNLNQLAKHANTGTLDVSKDVARQLEEAYQAVMEMRKALFIALGLKG